MTGSGVSGNKIRKLEFLLADALLQGCKSVITCGSIQSNHCRATAIAATELGLDCHLLLRSNITDESVLDNPGNLLPSVLCNSHLYLIPKSSKYAHDIKPMQNLLSKKMQDEDGIKAYSIPVGGSNEIGLFGYIEAWKEMMDQNVCQDFDDIVVACGSGGTIAGLTIANYLTGQKLKIHGFSVSDDKEYFFGHLNEMLKVLGIHETRAEEIVDIVDGYKGAGYGISTKEDREFYLEIAARTGIICDPVYTGKAVVGMLSEMKKNPHRFKGNRILFIHTGGIFSLYDGSLSSEIKARFRNMDTYKWESDSQSFKNLH